MPIWRQRTQYRGDLQQLCSVYESCDEKMWDINKHLSRKCYVKPEHFQILPREVRIIFNQSRGDCWMTKQDCLWGVWFGFCEVWMCVFDNELTRQLRTAFSKREKLEFRQCKNRLKNISFFGILDITFLYLLANIFSPCWKYCILGYKEVLIKQESPVLAISATQYIINTML